MSVALIDDGGGISDPDGVNTMVISMGLFFLRPL